MSSSHVFPSTHSFLFLPAQWFACCSYVWNNAKDPKQILAAERHKVLKDLNRTGDSDELKSSPETGDFTTTTTTDGSGSM